jgi:hypothetical protein
MQEALIWSTIYSANSYKYEPKYPIANTGIIFYFV